MKNRSGVLAASASAAPVASALVPAAQAAAPLAKSAHGTNSVTGVSHGMNTATQAELTRLIKALEWKESAGDTYAAVEFRAPQGKAALERQIAGAPQSVSNAEAYLETLDRLIVESSYLSELTNAERYTPGVLDSEMFLKGAIAEWNHALVPGTTSPRTCVWATAVLNTPHKLWPICSAYAYWVS